MNETIRPSRAAWLSFEEIAVSENARPYNAADVVALANSIRSIGLLTPLTVVDRGGRYLLVAGRHRLEALRLVQADKVPVRIVDFDDIEARLWTISENLHRTELTTLQRSEHVAEWIRLTEERRQPAQLEPAVLSDGRKGGHQHVPSGINAAARELGIDRNEAQRAVKIDSLASEAKEAAREAGLADNASALLEAAKQPTSEKQVAALKQRAETKASRPAHDLSSPAAALPAREIAHPLRNLVNISAGEFARWIKITTPRDRPHVIRVLETAASILRDEMDEGSAA